MIFLIWTLSFKQICYAFFSRFVMDSYEVRVLYVPLFTYWYAKLQQSHSDHICRAVTVADRKCLGLKYGNIPKIYITYIVMMSLITHRQTDSENQNIYADRRNKNQKVSHICTISNVLCKYLQWNGLGVIIFFSLTYSTKCRENHTRSVYYITVLGCLLFFVFIVFFMVFHSQLFWGNLIRETHPTL